MVRRLKEAKTRAEAAELLPEAAGIFEANMLNMEVSAAERRKSAQALIQFVVGSGNTQVDVDARQTNVALDANAVQELRALLDDERVKGLGLLDAGGSEA